LLSRRGPRPNLVPIGIPPPADAMQPVSRCPPYFFVLGPYRATRSSSLRETLRRTCVVPASYRTRRSLPTFARRLRRYTAARCTVFSTVWMRLREDKIGVILVGSVNYSERVRTHYFKRLSSGCSGIGCGLIGRTTTIRLPHEKFLASLALYIISSCSGTTPTCEHRIGYCPTSEISVRELSCTVSIGDSISSLRPTIPAHRSPSRFPLPLQP
jgi:hypothetical protein